MAGTRRLELLTSTVPISRSHPWPTIWKLVRFVDNRTFLGADLALGAQIHDLFSLVLESAAIILAAGLLVGILGAAALAKSLSALLFDVHPLDPVSFITAPLALTLVALAAAAIPASGAVRTNPAVVLRQE
jgi:putative ABC transport system permease protein